MTTTAPKTGPGTGQGRTWRDLGPITFEILRHRLWAINEEASTTIKLVSGSPVATEANDVNTGLMNARGDVCAVGYYCLMKATTLAEVVKDILQNYQDNPGINEEDGFICNDPYCGVAHCNDVAYVSPIYWESELIGWAGAEIHQVDVGGPVPGQVQLGAKDAYGEQPIIPPIKIVERGVMRRDIEREYLRHTRLPDLCALDLRAKIAAVNVTKQRVYQLIREFGVEAVKLIMDGMLDYVEERFRARLRELPDGTWRARTYIDFEGDVFPVWLAVTKQDDRLIFDFTGTARQAPAVINNARLTTIAWVQGEICNNLCWDIPWCPGGFSRAVEFITEPGTLVDAQWPAGVSKATTSIGHAMRDLVNIACGRMLASSATHYDKAMACWQGTNTHEELFGIDQRGKPFGQTLLDGMAGGTGARTWKDGIDTGGKINSMATIIANVESYEALYPILYLHRKELRDSGGAGKFRGGNGLSMMYIAHDVDVIPTKIMHVWGVEHPNAHGIYGGYPAASNQFVIKRNTHIEEMLASCDVPANVEDVEGGELEVFPAFGRTSLAIGDVYRCVNTGGGGYGDPLERDPSLVQTDYENERVSHEYARSHYGVVLVDGQVDAEATAQRREAIRAERRQRAEAPPKTFGNPPVGAQFTAPRSIVPRAPSPRVNEYLGFVWREGQPVIQCRCGQVIGPAEENYKHWVLVARWPVQRAGPEVNRYHLGEGRFELREFYCPGCATLLETEVAAVADPFLWDTQPNVREA